MPMSLKNNAGVSQQVGKVFYKGANGVVAEISKVFWKDSVGGVEEVHSGKDDIIAVIACMDVEGMYKKVGVTLVDTSGGSVISKILLASNVSVSISYINVNPISKMIYVATTSRPHNVTTYTTYVLNYNLDVLATHNNLCIIDINKTHILARAWASNTDQNTIRTYSGASIGGVTFMLPNNQGFFDDFGHYVDTINNTTARILNMNGGLINSITISYGGANSVIGTAKRHTSRGFIVSTATMLVSYISQVTLKYLSYVSVKAFKDNRYFQYLLKNSRGYLSSYKQKASFLGDAFGTFVSTDIDYPIGFANDGDDITYRINGEYLQLFNKDLIFIKSYVITTPNISPLPDHTPQVHTINYSPRFQ